QDLGPVPARRQTAPGTPPPALENLLHAALIAYHRYLDPRTGQPCPPELLVERLTTGQTSPPHRSLRLLAKLQGAFASHAGLWR
ncbi:MAG TPA: capsular polysaccharide biosynthesis protein, partial [Paracoccus sp.]|nr:capsular polysaccharide biosynthesis protein [Paracoccus sp. (in: a-proteobacteria)]